MQSEITGTHSAIELARAAREFATEVGASVERKKKPRSSPEGLQIFFLYIRVHGYVPLHQVSGAITVQTIVGHARLTAEGNSYDLPQGSMVWLPTGVPHELSASMESVLLVTHALQD
jgi:quercetin dioxygenase-like cupin family protein